MSSPSLLTCSLGRSCCSSANSCFRKLESYTVCITCADGGWSGSLPETRRGLACRRDTRGRARGGLRRREVSIGQRRAACRCLLEAAGCWCCRASVRSRTEDLDCDLGNLTRFAGGDGRRRHQCSVNRAARAPPNFLLEVDVGRRNACSAGRTHVSTARTRNTRAARQGTGARPGAVGRDHHALVANLEALPQNRALFGKLQA